MPGEIDPKNNPFRRKENKFSKAQNLARAVKVYKSSPHYKARLKQLRKQSTPKIGRNNPN